MAALWQAYPLWLLSSAWWLNFTAEDEQSPLIQIVATAIDAVVHAFGETHRKEFERRAQLKASQQQAAGLRGASNRNRATSSGAQRRALKRQSQQGGVTGTGSQPTAAAAGAAGTGSAAPAAPTDPPAAPLNHPPFLQAQAAVTAAISA